MGPDHPENIVITGLSDWDAVTIYANQLDHKRNCGPLGWASQQIFCSELNM
jgi:hypothetical protein